MSNVLSFIVEFYFEHRDTFGKTIVVSYLFYLDMFI